MRPSILLVSLPLVLLGGAAAAQTPAAPEFIVNTYSTDRQRAPSLSMDAFGRFVVVWESLWQDGSWSGVFGQRYDAAGGPVGVEFPVNTTTLSTQGLPDVAVDAKGDFVVAWSDEFEIKARRFSRLGRALGNEFLVNTYTTGIQRPPKVAADPAGNFVVVWDSLGQDGSSYGVFGQRFDAGGTGLGANFQVNVYTTGEQRFPDVAFNGDGGFVVVYDGDIGSSHGVFTRRYDAGGTAVGSEYFLQLGLNYHTAIVPLRPGGFVVAWTNDSGVADRYNVYAQMLDATGAPTTSAIRVNTYTTNFQIRPAVAGDGVGGFVVTWQSYLQDGSYDGVQGQRFNPSGAALGAEFALNTFTTGAQNSSAVAADSAGNFVAAWSSQAQDGSVSAVVGRRFQGLVPTGIAVDTLANGVLEPAETARIAPSWRNATGSLQTFQGTLSGFTGPLPATYTLTDPLADYGATPAGVASNCAATGDCYSVTVTASERPSAHWDATALETLSGAAVTQGLQKQWTLHVGDSFTDVPRTNGFYRFVETLLHNSITSGCAANQFCPGGVTTREQMAAFVLVAFEGAGYVPRACGTPLFTDVPASSPFCRWIEELARRGVVSGCGPGRYCPSDPVTRAQLCVFVLRVLDPDMLPPPCATTPYSDVPSTSPFCPWIQELSRRGVVTGCGGGNFCPDFSVTREQMGVFLSVTFGLTLYGP